MKSRLKLFSPLVLVLMFVVVPARALLQMSDAELADSMPEDPGKKEITKLCTGCHPLVLVVTQKKTPQQWRSTVDDMISRGAQLFEEEVDSIVSYLSKHYRVPEGDPEPPAREREGAEPASGAESSPSE